MARRSKTIAALWRARQKSGVLFILEILSQPSPPSSIRNSPSSLSRSFRVLLRVLRASPRAIGTEANEGNEEKRGGRLRYLRVLLCGFRSPISVHPSPLVVERKVLHVKVTPP